MRTSPDHGVAFDIAGQDKADPQSMRNAIYLATDIVNNRRAWAEWTSNPLPHAERERGKRRCAYAYAVRLFFGIFYLFHYRRWLHDLPSYRRDCGRGL